ncbi:DMT family transporter [Thermosediminibacter litoriperuensis]|uniref:Transporter family-2 protein n=1 Tax=Thermosediminibacter litoriperuensis TaxID=291989 RepID=A0A5S5B0I9_9FIRM|nr:transporter family-2 protein [Thermosediminibacter litoriperuensis]
MNISGDLFFLIVAIMAGVFMAVQGSMNSVVSRAIGLSGATFIVHLTATLIMTAVILSGAGKSTWVNYTRVPWYDYLGGAIGVLITYAVVMSIPRLGAAVATTAIIVGQVLTACLLDHFGFFGLEKMPFTWMRFLGLVLLSIGAKLLLN